MREMALVLLKIQEQLLVIGLETRVKNEYLMIMTMR